MAGAPQAHAVERKRLRNLRGLQLTSTDRLDSTLREPQTKRLLKVPFEGHEQLSPSSQFSFLGLYDARCESQRDDDYPTAVRSIHYQSAS